MGMREAARGLGATGLMYAVDTRWWSAPHLLRQADLIEDWCLKGMFGARVGIPLKACRHLKGERTADRSPLSRSVRLHMAIPPRLRART